MRGLSSSGLLRRGGGREVVMASLIAYGEVNGFRGMFNKLLDIL